MKDEDETNEEGVDEQLERDVARALAKRDLLLPERPEEVQRSEEAGIEDSVPLPPRLASFRGYQRSGREAPAEAAEAAARPQPAEVIPLRATRRERTYQVVRHAFGFALGAAAATLVWVGLEDAEESVPLLGGATQELRDAPELPSKPPKVDLSTLCVGCCAGADCNAAPPEQRSCPSGRRCVECESSVEANVMKLRSSALGVNDEGRAWLASAGHDLGSLSLCADARGLSLGCRSASGEAGDLVEWSSLPVAVNTSQLVGGLGVTLQAGPAGAPLATFRSAVTLSAETLCRGVAARLELPDGRVVGKVSVFFQDTHFVELGRAATVPRVLALAGRYEFEGGAPDVYETSQPGERRFGLVLGPLARATAERIRWQLLEQDVEAEITLGDDHRGPPRPR